MELSSFTVNPRYYFVCKPSNMPTGLQERRKVSIIPQQFNCQRISLNCLGDSRKINLEGSLRT